MPQVRIEATDPTMVKAQIDNFEGSYNEIEAKDLNIVKNYRYQRGTPQQNCTQYGNGRKPIFRGTMLILIEAMAVDLNISEDVVVVGPTIRITMEHISTSITHMTHNWNNMVLPAVYVADLTIPPSTATRVNTI